MLRSAACLACAVTGSAVGLWPRVVQAQSVVAAPGSTQVQQTQNQYTITGGSQSQDGTNLFHSFQQFGLTQAEVATFLADPNVRNILGRVNSSNPSVIDGLLQVHNSDANLFLINPSGILFGPNAQLDLSGSFMATTAEAIRFGDRWLTADQSGDYSQFGGDPTGLGFGAPGAIVNAGDLVVASGQSLSLVGGTVINTGSLSAPGGGQVAIAALNDGQGIRLSREDMALALDLIDVDLAVLNTTGLVPTQLPELLTGGNLGSATGLSVTADGTVQLTGAGVTLPTTAGTAIAAGDITATGGDIAVLGNQVAVVGATLDTSSANGGGQIRIGGDYQGQGDLLSAQRTAISPDAVLRADATDAGDGGRIIIWADDATQFYGLATAQGGSNSGDGGFIEVSGHRFLTIQGETQVSAPNGAVGTVLLDPDFITIIAGDGGTLNARFMGNSGNIFSDDPDVGANTLSASQLEAMGADANIVLQANNGIRLDTSLNLQIARGGSITFIADGNHDGIGDFTMNPGNSIQTRGGSVTIEAINITTGDIIISASDGRIVLRAEYDISTQLLFNENGIDLTARTGSITVDRIDTRGDLSVTAFGSFRVTGSLERFVQERFSLIERPDLIQMLLDSGVSESLIYDGSGNLILTQVLVNSVLPISVFVSNPFIEIDGIVTEVPASISIRHGGVEIPAEITGDRLLIQNTPGTSGDFGFFAGPNVVPGDSDFLITVDVLGFLDQIERNETYSLIELPAGVSGTVGAIILGSGSNADVINSFRNASFLPEIGSGEGGISPPNPVISQPSTPDIPISAGNSANAPAAVSEVTVTNDLNPQCSVVAIASQSTSGRAATLTSSPSSDCLGQSEDSRPILQLEPEVMGDQPE
jgi:filamentous hemagglutinin family protein